MVIFADKGRPLKPLSRIIIACLLFITLVLARELIEGILNVSFAGLAWTLFYPLIFTAAAAALTLHVVMLNWREAVLVALISGALAQFLQADTWQQFMIQWLAISAGVYLLPLVDPTVRKQEQPLPKLRYLLISGLVLTGIALLVDLYVFAGQSGRQFFGLGVLILGGTAALVLATLGYVATIAAKTHWGIILGGTGLLTALFAYLTWLMLGTPWFP